MTAKKATVTRCPVCDEPPCVCRDESKTWTIHCAGLYHNDHSVEVYAPTRAKAVERWNAAFAPALPAAKARRAR